MTETRIRTTFAVKLSMAAGLTAASLFAMSPSRAKAQAAQPQYPVPSGNLALPAQKVQLPPLPTPTAITPNGQVVEDVVVRVNDQIITRSEVERAQQQLVQDAQQSGTPAQEVATRERDLLRDMIDNQLLLSKGKELGITCDAETIRQLDEIRKQNHLDSMEALEKAAAQQGVSFEDFKANVRNACIRQQVVRDQVGRRLQPTKAQEQAYYEEHKKEFEQPEQVHLSEILVPTPENATDDLVNQAQAKASDIAAKLKAGAKFADTAKASSGGPSAAQGGELGDFKRGALAKVLEDATFSLPAGGITEPIRTRQGFVILRTDSHTSAGVAPLADVEQQVQEGIYFAALQPALRAYLTKAREDAYVDIKPGFVDSGSSRRESKPVFTAYTAPVVKKKTEEKRRMEQQKDAAAQAHLAEVREQAAAKAAAKAGKKGGLTNVSMVKAKKVRREKVRFGQAPRNALPAAPVATVQGADTPLAGQAPGVAMAGANSSGTILSSGTGPDNDPDPLTPKPVAQKKTRYTARQADIELARANDKAVKAREHQAARPIVATKEEKVTEQTQAAPLGLNGDTAKKKKVKIKRAKGEPKERLQEKTKPVETPVPIAPTVNPALGGPAVQAPVQPKPDVAPSSDRSTLPSTTAAPGSLQPPPSASPSQPQTTVPIAPKP